MLGGQVEEAQENLRLSTQQQGRLNHDLNDYRNKLDLNIQESDTFKQRISKLLSENSNLGEEVRSAQ